MSRLTPITVAFLALVPWSVAACSSGAPASPQPTRTAAGPSAVPHAALPQPHIPDQDDRACAVAPSAMVGAALGLPVGKVAGTVEGPVTVCAYQGRYEVIVRFQRGENASQFAASKAASSAMHQVIGRVTGLGSAAYLATYTLAKPSDNTLAALRGTVAVFITSPAPPAAERALMVRLLAGA